MLAAECSHEQRPGLKRWEHGVFTKHPGASWGFSKDTKRQGIGKGPRISSHKDVDLILKANRLQKCITEKVVYLRFVDETTEDS